MTAPEMIAPKMLQLENGGIAVFLGALFQGGAGIEQLACCDLVSHHPKPLPVDNSNKVQLV